MYFSFPICKKLDKKDRLWLTSSIPDNYNQLLNNISSIALNYQINRLRKKLQSL